MAIANVYATYRECTPSTSPLFSLTGEQKRAVIAYLMDSVARGCVWLQTCNRVELYLSVSEDTEPEAVLSAFSRGSALTCSCVSVRWGDEAESHLFDVATTLDSMVVGEHQILGQVRDAMREASVRGTLSEDLGLLFSSAIRAGRRARAETAICKGNVSMASVAVSMAEAYVGTLSGARCFVLGAGKISRMIATILANKGAGLVCVTNRTDSRAADLAAVTGAVAVPYASYLTHLAACDVLFCASSAPHSLIHGPDLLPAIAARQIPLVIIDIAVPPDVDAEVRNAGEVRYLGMDDVRAHTRYVESSRIGQIPAVRSIIAHERAALRRAARTGGNEEAVADISSYVEAIRKDELARLVSGPLTPETVDAFSRSVVKKAFYHLYRNIHDGSCPSGLACAVRDLFVMPCADEKSDDHVSQDKTTTAATE